MRTKERVKKTVRVWGIQTSHGWVIESDGIGRSPSLRFQKDKVFPFKTEQDARNAMLGFRAGGFTVRYQEIPID